MRVFWAVVVALAVVGAWFVLIPRVNAPSVAPPHANESLDSSAVATATEQAGSHDAKPGERSSATQGSTTGSTTGSKRGSTKSSTTSSTNTATNGSTNNASSSTTSTATNRAPISAPASAPSEPAPPRAEIDLLGEDDALNAQVPTPPTPPAPLAAKIPSTPRTLLTDTRLPSEVITRLDERTVELDGRFRVTGSGTEADPSRISWELLTSASAYIDPAQGAMTPPPWVRLLDGTTIELSGYYSTAVRTPVAKNLLLTLNRWDGCCIGLPPTPFDAIDITMREPLPMRGLHLVRFGTFRGRLIVEPLAAAGFLLSLYRLEDVTFETK